MLRDYQNTFSAAQAATAIATAVSDNVLDQVVAGDAADELYVVFVVTTAMASAGAATFQFILQHDTAVGMGTATTLYNSGALDYTDFVAGKRIIFRLPKGTKRYLRCTYTIGTAVLTGGAWTCFLTPTPDTNPI